MHSNTIIRILRILLFPVSFLYGIAVKVRNYCYDKKYFRSATFDLPVICVGNLTAGGTGKSPMVEHLIALLKPTHQVATLSRGYKRSTKGYLLAQENTTASQIGDEPMQFHVKHPNIAVAVGEDRALAIPQLLNDRPEIQTIILDDAFQHRSVTAGYQIVLTDYSNLFTRDYFLPTGYLRDERNSYKRADCIVVAKCPSHLSINEKQKIITEIKPLPHQKIFFTSVIYGMPYHLFNNKNPHGLHKSNEILIVTGIANPKPLVEYIHKRVHICHLKAYGDHHEFQLNDIENIKKNFESLESDKKLIITTEKDATRLYPFRDQLKDLPVYVMPIQIQFLFEEGSIFEKEVKEFVQAKISE